jgi:LacI family transcriptional regulator
MANTNQELLAKKLNISRTTVSRSLANHPAISAETRARVQSLAEELGYRSSPGRRARRVKASRALTIGVLIGVPAENVTMATFPFLLKGIRECAELERVEVDILYQPPGEFHPESSRQPVFRHIRSGDWRGALLIYPFPEPAVDLIAKKISTVSLLENYDNPLVDTIDTDEVAGIVALVRQLAAAGHQRIGFLTWNYPVGGHWSLQRFGGYVEGLFSLGLQFNPHWVLNIHKDSPRLDTAHLCDHVIRHWQHDHVTAWVCAADHQAYQLMQDLKTRGVRVPEDISITGFDGLEPPAHLRRVTSMQVPHGDIGMAAVSRLLNRIIHPHSPRRKILVEAKLLPGESIAPPRRS